ncbi:MAG: glycoside hydrolase family 15 protein [Acetobacteraceae bacterium]
MPMEEQPRADQTVEALSIEDYALIGDCKTSALVGRNGSIDWLCWPRFDSAACFAALLGNADNGHWLIAPAAAQPRVTRAYRDGGLVLETLFETPTGTVALVDFMVPEALDSTIVRIIEGRSGSVAMTMAMVLRFDYGASIPWVTRLEDDAICAIAGPEMTLLRSSAPLEGRGMTTVADFTIEAGQSAWFTLTHRPSHLPAPPAVDAAAALAKALAYWTEWADRCTYRGAYQAAVRRSLVVLKALTYGVTGGIVAAPTTSLPEQLGGTRNWDYRFCWLRDATLTLYSLMHAGYFEEAAAWRDWLHRSVAGSPDQIQIMYGIGGERRLTEWEVPWLGGYQGAAPVRIGNAASEQLQIDMYGELTEALHQARTGGLAWPPESWELQCAIIEHLETIWRLPDEGIWEVRGGPQLFTYSKVMAWVAFDRMVQDVEQHGLDGPVERWRAVRDEIHATVCEQGFNPQKNAFVQAFGSDQLDASCLIIPLVGFLPHDDPRVLGTTAAVERELLKDGFVLRYSTADSRDGLPPGEGAFLACSFWLVDNWHMQGREAEALALFERLVGLSNDVGLLSEEYDPAKKRFTGNFPQAFTHTALISSALTLNQTGLTHAREAARA